MRIVFMGAPDFAVLPLKKLHEQGYDVAAVVTQPDRPKGRGRKLAPPPVKEEAMRLGLPVLQPENPKTPEFISELAGFEADVFVVIAYGHILTKEVLALPKIMPINIHASILPAYRGPAPIQWSIINGDAKTGVTAMRMDVGMDTGDVLSVAEVDIEDTDTSETLHDKLSQAGADLLINILDNLDSITPTPQEHDKATYARALSKADGEIRWEEPAFAIERLIRGVTPWPGAFTFLDGKRMRFLEARLWDEPTQAAPGTVISSTGGVFLVATGDGVLNITRVQGASGKPLKAEDYLRGARIDPGVKLG
ncbi:methionyl-tRNA formyltransferase [Desulfatibacillum aliphaticivorans]|nr:methionyl-tRNA formyltransferase [Desulfatibacillum aliphaticivorans]